MDNVVDFLKTFASLIIACLTVGVAFTIIRAGRQAGLSVAEMIDNTTVSITEQSKTKFEGITATGSEVVNHIRRHKSSTPVLVEILQEDGTFRRFQFSGKSQLLNLPTDIYYVNPNSLFLGAVERNANDSITKLVFTQVSDYTSNADPDDVVDVGTGQTGTSTPSTPSTDSSTAVTSEQFTTLMNELRLIMQNQAEVITLMETQIESIHTILSTNTGNSNTDNSAQFDALGSRLTSLESTVNKLTESLDKLTQTVEDVLVYGTSGLGEIETMAATMSISLQSLNAELEELESTEQLLASEENSSRVQNMKEQLEEATNTLATMIDESLEAQLNE